MSQEDRRREIQEAGEKCVFSYGDCDKGSTGEFRRALEQSLIRSNLVANPMIGVLRNGERVVFCRSAAYSGEMTLFHDFRTFAYDPLCIPLIPENGKDGEEDLNLFYFVVFQVIEVLKSVSAVNKRARIYFEGWTSSSSSKNASICVWQGRVIWPCAGRSFIQWIGTSSIFGMMGMTLSKKQT